MLHLHCRIQCLHKVVLRVPLFNPLNLIFNVSLGDILHLSEHLHCEDEGATLVLTRRLDINKATVSFNDTFANHEAHANAFRVLSSCPFKFSKHVKQRGHLRIGDASPRVNHVNLQHLLHFIVGSKNFNSSMPSELQRILDQIDQDLLQAHDVSVEYLGHRGFLKHNHVIRHIVGFHQRSGLEGLVGHFILSHL